MISDTSIRKVKTPESVSASTQVDAAIHKVQVQESVKTGSGRLFQCKSELVSSNNISALSAASDWLEYFLALSSYQETSHATAHDYCLLDVCSAKRRSVFSKDDEEERNKNTFTSEQLESEHFNNPIVDDRLSNYCSSTDAERNSPASNFT